MDQPPLSYLDTEAPPVTLEFSYAPDEFTRFALWSMFRRWWIFLPAFLVIASLEWLGQVGESDPGWFQVPWMAAFITAIVAGIFAYVCLAKGRQIWKTTAYVREPIVATLTPTALHWQAKGLTSTQELATLHGATETGTHMVLWLNAASAYLIPKRALRGADDLARLRNYLRTGLPGTARVKLQG